MRAHSAINRADARRVGALAVGFWSVYVCQYWIGIQTTLVPELWGWLNGYGFKVIALVIIGTLFCARLLRPETLVVLDVLSAACVEVGVFLLSSLLDIDAGADVTLVASALAEVGLAWLIARWGARNATVPLRSAFLSFVVGALLMSLSKTLLAFLPGAASSALMLLVTPLSIAMLVRAPTDWGFPGVSSEEPKVGPAGPIEGSGESTAPIQGLATTFVRLACVAAVFFLVWSYLNVTSKFEVGHYGYGDTSQPVTVLLSQLLAVAFFLAAFIWSFVLRRDIDLEGLWRMAILWLAAAVAASAILDFSLLSQAFVSSAFEFGYFLLCLSITAYCHHTTTSPSAIAAFGNLALVVSQWAVRAFVGVVGAVGLSVEAASLVFVALVATLVVLLPGRSPDAQLMTTGLNDGAQGRGAMDGDEEGLARLAGEYGLTDREAEVVLLICYGRTKRYIAEAMCLSENTVRTYSHRAYQKLGVHNRGELQSLLWGDEGPVT